MVNLSAFHKVSKIAYFVAFITFCMRAGQFMSLPFLAIYLSRDGLFTPGQIGLVLGISGLMLSITSLMNGMYLDRTSHKKVILTGLVLSSCCYFTFSISMHHFLLLLLINAALGWLRSLVEISSLTMLIDHTQPEDLTYAYSARFIGANLGVFIGPLIGALMANHHSMLIFFIAGGINIVLAVMICFYHEKENNRETIKSYNLLSHFSVVIKDKLLISITLINFILYLVYCLLDTTIPQYLAHSWKNPATIYSILMVINAVICVLFQTVILRWAELTSLKKFGIIGSMMFSTSFIILSISTTVAPLIISVIIMSFAELFTLPINSLLIMRIAPKHLMASYNGLSNFGLLGLSIGPVLGGYGLQYLGGSITFFIAFLLPFSAAMIYFWHIADNIKPSPTLESRHSLKPSQVENPFDSQET